ncbi:MAG: exodeoxyribonuclease VII small subunit [Deltaproteobacteria bacterium]|nr:exodeoxyribonuclease VII small subunit [Deltaproteobacteria bacterium]
MAKVQQTFEKRLERIREITALLEDGALALEDGVKLFQEGMRLSKECGAELEKARIVLETAERDGTLAPEGA